MARTRFLERRSEEVLSNSDLETLWHALVEHAEEPKLWGKDALSWQAFRACAASLPERFAALFDASVFLKLPLDRYGRVDVLMLFHLVMKRAVFEQHRITLAFYDVDGHGYLREAELENFITELIPSVPVLAALLPSFHPCYVSGAVRRFMFQLDPLRKGKVRIAELVATPAFAELIAVRDGRKGSETYWFQPDVALRVYGKYLELDEDQNGMLSPAELKGFDSELITDMFIGRIFQVYNTYSGEMDFKGFLDFVLAHEYKTEPGAIRYFFRAFDLNGDGRLDEGVLNVFLREVLREFEGTGHEVSVGDVLSELFDLVNPAEPGVITLDDLLRGGPGVMDTFVTLLTDAAGFYAYDNRESARAQQAADEALDDEDGLDGLDDDVDFS